MQQWLQQFWQLLQEHALLDGMTFSDFSQAFDLMGLQRHIKVLGIFARLSIRDDKHGYLQDLPTVVSYVRAVAANIRQHGSDYWFRAAPQELLDGYDPAFDPDAPAWVKSSELATAGLVKSHDIFDVWFESGSSWNAVLRQRDLGYPADLYLEGSDQHRGWFQLSLLPALGVTHQSPFKAVLTHGFMVDKDGRKMSKSGGNALEVDTLLKDFGADVCRWWVGSLNADNDIKVDHEFFRVAGEEYRKVRNTIRYLLSNLSDFDPHQDRYRFSQVDAASVDVLESGEIRRQRDVIAIHVVHDAATASGVDHLGPHDRDSAVRTGIEVVGFESTAEHRWLQTERRQIQDQRPYGVDDGAVASHR